MNFVAIIGIVDQLKKDNENKQTIITVNCEKPTANVGDENWYDQIEVTLDDTNFQEEIEKVDKGEIVGIKGRIIFDNANKFFAERLQVF